MRFVAWFHVDNILARLRGAGREATDLPQYTPFDRCMSTLYWGVLLLFVGIVLWSIVPALLGPAVPPVTGFR